MKMFLQLFACSDICRLNQVENLTRSSMNFQVLLLGKSFKILIYIGKIVCVEKFASLESFEPKFFGQNYANFSKQNLPLCYTKNFSEICKNKLFQLTAEVQIDRSSNFSRRVACDDTI